MKTATTQKLKWAVIARNDDQRTLDRIREFASAEYLKTIKSYNRGDWVDNICLHARFSHWGFATQCEANDFASDLNAIVVRDDNERWTSTKLKMMLKSHWFNR